MENPADIIPFLIIIAILILLVIFCSKSAIKLSKQKKKNKQKIQELKEQGANNISTFMLVSGLPLPENTLCRLISWDNRIEIEANGTKFNLDKSKINDVCIKTDVEFKSQYVSSAGGAVAGAMLFGSVGAAIGGRVKEKKTQEVHTYLIFTYEKNDTIDYIGFDATYSLKRANNFVNEFKEEKQNNKVIEL